ncbi:GumC family protein [Sphingobacterium sp. SYP-B4668]|uniref:GumC family protein n=1 Tax=Sphingobacterium sp. SYP-B4668 TaxID=2996035 RepID=UPI0022DD3E72|nr:tyrosine-protein kinase [Sphingobacterium sp. SYP-B4668]
MRSIITGTSSGSEQGKTINILDILKYLLFHWKWFVLSILCFSALYYYQYAKAPFVYSSFETVMIKTPMNTPTTARLNRATTSFNSVSVASEILQLKTKELMRETVRRIDGLTSYSMTKGLRNVELYKSSPIQIRLSNDNATQQFEVKVVPVDKQTVMLTWDGRDNKATEAKLNTEVSTPIGKLTVVSTIHYKEDYYGKEITARRGNLESLVSYFMGNLKITQMEQDASLLRIEIDDRNPQRGADLITEMVNVYNEMSLDSKSQIAKNTASFIEDRLSIIQSELAEVETDIEQLRRNNQGVNVDVAGEMYLTDSRQFQTERTKIETDLKLAQMMQQHLNSSNKQGELIPNNTGLVDVNVESQIEAYNTMLLRKNRLIEGSSTSNPVVRDLDASLTSMRNNIDRAVENALGGLEVKVRNARREEGVARGKAMQMPQKQRIMLSVERQQKVKEELYLYLLNKREENALNQAMTDDNIRVIDPASVDYSPKYPSKVRKVITGAGIGGVLPAIVLLLILMLDTEVRSKKDIEDTITAPFLGEIPLSKENKNNTTAIGVNRIGRDPLTETFRILRTNIGLMSREGKPPKVVTLTSFAAGVGKTFSSINLSATLSFLDKKVVVVDLDLRKGTLSARLGLSHQRGSTQYLADENITLDDILHPVTDFDNLHCVPIGMVAPNPVELLLSKRLDNLIRELKERYDYVIVDGVPVGIVADANIVDRISDMTIFVVRAGKMDRRQLPEIEKIYRDRKLTNLAVLLNGVTLNRSGYGYGGYGYSYGGYGYGEEPKKNIFTRWFYAR